MKSARSYALPKLAKYTNAIVELFTLCHGSDSSLKELLVLDDASLTMMSSSFIEACVAAARTNLAIKIDYLAEVRATIIGNLNASDCTILPRFVTGTHFPFPTAGFLKKARN